jgi:transposase-like protein
MAAATNLVDLIERFGDEDRCREYLEQLRWPDGVECPRCGSTKIVHVRTRNQFTCKGRNTDGQPCGYRFSVRAGTIFQDSKLSLTKWFLAIYIVGESKKGVSAQQLSRMLNTTAKTSWFLCHRIRAAMGRSEEDGPPLDGIVEVDETFVGGRWADGRPHHEKTLVAGAIQRDGDVRLRVIPDRKRHTLHQFIKTVVADDAEAIYTDELHSYRGIADVDTRHETVNHEWEWVRGDVHTNTVEGVWSLFKRSIVGSYHQLSTKHLDAYLGEIAFRFNNRENPYLFRDTLLALLHSDCLTYDRLIAPTGV